MRNWLNVIETIHQEWHRLVCNSKKLSVIEMHLFPDRAGDFGGPHSMGPDRPAPEFLVPATRTELAAVCFRNQGSGTSIQRTGHESYIARPGNHSCRVRCTLFRPSLVAQGLGR